MFCIWVHVAIGFLRLFLRLNFHSLGLPRWVLRCGSMVSCLEVAARSFVFTKTNCLYLYKPERCSLVVMIMARWYLVIASSVVWAAYTQAFLDAFSSLGIDPWAGIEMDVAWGHTTLRFGLHRPSVTGPIFVYRVCTSFRQDAPTRMQVLSHISGPIQLKGDLKGTLKVTLRSDPLRPPLKVPLKVILKVPLRCP